MTTTLTLATALIPDVDSIARAIAQTFDITIVDPHIPTLSATVKPFPYMPEALDTYELPAFYLYRVGDQTPDLDNDGHSTSRGTFTRDFEFHLACATIGQQASADREQTSRKIITGCVYNWLQNYELKLDGEPLPFVEDWWYTGDRGLALLPEYNRVYLGSVFTFRVRSRWARP